MSFDLDSLARFQTIAPLLPRVVLFDTETDVGDAVAAAVDLDAEVAPIGYRSFGWDISAIHGAGKVAHPWVINEGWQRDLVNGFGADGVFTDFAERWTRAIIDVKATAPAGTRRRSRSRLASARLAPTRPATCSSTNWAFGLCTA